MTLLFACNDCDWSGSESQTSFVEATQRRFEQGDVYTTAQCPKCGALAQPFDPMASDFLIRIPGSVVREIYRLVRVDAQSYVDSDTFAASAALIDVVLDHHGAVLGLSKHHSIHMIRNALVDLMKCPELHDEEQEPETRRAVTAAAEALEANTQ